MNDIAPAGTHELRCDCDAVPAQPLLRDAYTFVLAGGRGTRLGPLTERHAKPAVPFGGHLRIVDFTLSNCANSGLARVAVLTQYRAQTLIRHLALGAAQPGGLPVDIVPAQQKTGEGWYRGTADAVYQNLDLVDEAHARWVVVLAGDHVYRMDYGRLLAQHVHGGAHATIACVPVPAGSARHFGVLQVDAGRRVQGFEEKPLRPSQGFERNGRVLASMGIYVFDADALRSALRRDAADPRSTHDFGHDVLPSMVARARVLAHDFALGCVQVPGAEAYWRDVGTIDGYFDAHMDLLGPRPALDLHDAAWPIRGVAQPLPPARWTCVDADRAARVVDTMVAAGCVVGGAAVHRSVLFNGARVGDGSRVDASLLLPGASVGRDAVIRRAIVGEDCALPDGIRIGVDPAADRARFAVSEQGVVVVSRAMLEARLERPAVAAHEGLAILP